MVLCYKKRYMLRLPFRPPARAAWPSMAAVTAGFILTLLPHAVPDASAQWRDQAVTLRDTLALARTQSPARQASAARVEAADLSRTWAGRLPNPITELRWENMAPGLRDVLPLDVFATVTQPIELGGKRDARKGIAAAAADAARASLWATERAVDAEVVRRYLTVVRQRDRSRTLAQHTDELAEVVRILERRVAEGVTAEADLRKIETERARVDTDAARARIAAGRELAGLAALVGWASAPPLEALERPTVSAPTGAAVTAAIERRPDVRLAASRLDASRQSLRFEQSRQVPDLNITGGFKRTAGYDTGVLAVLMPVPLFERNRVNVVLARGNLSAAALELEQARRFAVADVNSAMLAAQELGRRSAEAATHLVQPADIVRRAARAAFTSGAGDLLRLVDAERVYADARLAVEDLSFEALLAAIEARLALAEEAVP